jgi:hypothetical protein
MANAFLVNTKSDVSVAVITDSGTNVLTAGATATLILLSIRVANKVGSSANVDVYLATNTGDDVYIIRNAPIPAGSSLEIMAGSKIIMEPQDILRARSDTGSALDVTVSYLEQTP